MKTESIGASSAADTDNDAYFFQTGTASVILEGCNVTGFVGIDVSTVTIRDTTKEYVGSIVTDNDIDPSQWCVCSLGLWNGTTSPYILNRGASDNETTIDNQCDEICVFSGPNPPTATGLVKLAWCWSY